MFKIICSECENPTTTDTAKGMREHANGVYSFLCRNCYPEREQA